MGYSEATIIASSFVVPPEGEAAALRTLTERLLGGGERLFDNSDGALDNLDGALGGYGWRRVLSSPSAAHARLTRISS